MSNLAWKSLFADWPTEIPRRGVIVTTLNEQIPFAGFLTSEGLLLLERQTPDAMGGRTVVVPLDNIAALKFTDAVQTRAFAKLGFQGPPGKS